MLSEWTGVTDSYIIGAGQVGKMCFGKFPRFAACVAVSFLWKSTAKTEKNVLLITVLLIIEKTKIFAIWIACFANS